MVLQPYTVCSRVCPFSSFIDRGHIWVELLDKFFSKDEQLRVFLRRSNVVELIVLRYVNITEFQVVRISAA